MERLVKLTFCLVLVLIFTTFPSRTSSLFYSGFTDVAAKRSHRRLQPALKQTLLNRFHSKYESIDECCPSHTEVIQPRGGVSKHGRILELYADENSTQKFFQTSCREGVKGRSCQYINYDIRQMSRCVQKYSYTYALVREFGVSKDTPWRLDHIRVRSGCTCEIRRKRLNIA